MKLSILIPTAAVATLALTFTMMAQEKPAAVAPAPAAKTVVSEQDFMKIVAADCGRCHKKQCADLNTLKTIKWVKPGDPSQSRLYTIIGRHKKMKDGSTISVTPEHKQAISDFIAGLKP